MNSNSTAQSPLALLKRLALASIFIAGSTSGASRIPEAAAEGLIDAKQANERLYNAIKDSEHTCIVFGGQLAVYEQRRPRGSRAPGSVAKNELIAALCELPKLSDIKVFEATPEFIRQHFTESDGVFISGGYEQGTHRAIPFRK